MSSLCHIHMAACSRPCSCGGSLPHCWECGGTNCIDGAARNYSTVPDGWDGAPCSDGRDIRWFRSWCAAADRAPLVVRSYCGDLDDGCREDRSRGRHAVFVSEGEWLACDNAGQLLLGAAVAGVDRRLIVFGAAACANLALPVWEAAFPNDPRPRRAIEAAVCGDADAAALAAREATIAAARAISNAYAAARAAWAAARCLAASLEASAAWAAVRAAGWAAAAGVQERDLCSAIRLTIPWKVVDAAMRARS